jgi:hypothetical protein
MASIPKVIDFKSAVGETLRYLPAADRIISGNPQQTATVLFESADKRFVSGIWECEPGKWRVVFTESEFVQLLAGVLVVDSDDGSRTTYRAGDVFLTPAGFTGTWEVVERARKHFAYYE